MQILTQKDLEPIWPSVRFGGIGLFQRQTCFGMDPMNVSRECDRSSEPAPTKAIQVMQPVANRVAAVD